LEERKASAGSSLFRLKAENHVDGDKLSYGWWTQDFGPSMEWNLQAQKKKYVSK
jgi:hypothetical protein